MINPSFHGPMSGPYGRNPSYVPSHAGSRIEEVYSEHGTPMHPIQPMGSHYGPESIHPATAVDLPGHSAGELPPSPIELDEEGRVLPHSVHSHTGPPSTIFDRTSSIHHPQSPYGVPHGTTPANSLTYSPAMTMQSANMRRSLSRSRSRSRHNSRLRPYRHRRDSFSSEEGDILLLVDDNADIEVCLS
jgi:hypothetical protein